MKKRMLQRFGMVILAIALMMSLATTCFAGDSSVISDARNGVVRILTVDSETNRIGVGSGFGVGEAGKETQYFVTNWHVIADEENRVGTTDIYILLDNDAVEQGVFLTDVDPGADGKLNTADDLYICEEYLTKADEIQMIKCEVVYSADKYPDVAILKAERKVPGHVALPLKSAREMTVASEVYALGFPSVADATSKTFIDKNTYKLGDQIEASYLYAESDSVHITSGVISKLDQFESFGGTYCVAHGSNINKGNSGGPLLDADGNVIGINTYGSTEDALFYSVYIDYAMDYLNQLGIKWDGPVKEETYFPVIPVVLGCLVVVVLVILLIILLAKKQKKKPTVDTGLRVQYGPEAMMANKRLVINGTMRFGRAADCNVRYPEKAPGISGHHCEILVENGMVYIRDLNSSHGTFVNGNRIAANQLVKLSEGAQVSLAAQKESFCIVKSGKL